MKNKCILWNSKNYVYLAGVWVSFFLNYLYNSVWIYNKIAIKINVTVTNRKNGKQWAMSKRIGKEIFKINGWKY